MTTLNCNNSRMTITNDEIAITIDGVVRIKIEKSERPADQDPLPPLSPEEEIYGRNLCLLPSGWEDLSGEWPWQNELSNELRNLWQSLSREQRMAVAYSISELYDEM